VAAVPSGPSLTPVRIIIIKRTSVFPEEMKTLNYVQRGFTMLAPTLKRALMDLSNWQYVF
jgi:hypothetical protein